MRCMIWLNRAVIWKTVRTRRTDKADAVICVRNKTMDHGGRNSYVNEGVHWRACWQ